MTTPQLLNTARTPGRDLYGRMELIQALIEGFVKEAIEIPEVLNFRQVLLLARMAKDPDSPIKPGNLLRDGYYMGSNVSYNLKQLVENGFVTLEAGIDKRSKWVKLTKAGKEFGIDVALQLNFVETQIGELFSDELYRKMRSFLGETIYGGDVVRPIPAVNKKRLTEPA